MASVTLCCLFAFIAVPDQWPHRFRGFGGGICVYILNWRSSLSVMAHDVQHSSCSCLPRFCIFQVHRLLGLVVGGVADGRAVKYIPLPYKTPRSPPKFLLFSSAKIPSLLSSQLLPPTAENHTALPTTNLYRHRRGHHGQDLLHQAEQNQPIYAIHSTSL